MTEFKVGDRVTAFDSARGEITYGPVHSTFRTFMAYAVKVDEGGEVLYKTSDLSREAPAFSVGDKVTSTVSFRGEPGTIVAGPFDASHGTGNFWVMERDGKHQAPGESTLTKVPDSAPEPIEVGDMVRVLKDGADGAAVRSGDLFVTTRVNVWGVNTVGSGLGGEWHFVRKSVEKADPDSYAVHDGVVYDLAAEYHDSDTDNPGPGVWHFERLPDGKVRGARDGGTVGRLSPQLDGVVEMFGPLTKI